MLITYFYRVSNVVFFLPEKTKLLKTYPNLASPQIHFKLGLFLEILARKNAVFYLKNLIKTGL